MRHKSNYGETKIIRIPTPVKAALDTAQPPGVELWKFTADVITIGLEAIKQLRALKPTEQVADYDVASILGTAINGASKRKKRGE